MIIIIFVLIIIFYVCGCFCINKITNNYKLIDITNIITNKKQTIKKQKQNKTKTNNKETKTK